MKPVSLQRNHSSFSSLFTRPYIFLLCESNHATETDDTTAIPENPHPDSICFLSKLTMGLAGAGTLPLPLLPPPARLMVALTLLWAAKLARPPLPSLANAKDDNFGGSGGRPLLLLLSLLLLLPSLLQLLFFAGAGVAAPAAAAVCCCCCCC